MIKLLDTLIQGMFDIDNVSYAFFSYSNNQPIGLQRESDAWSIYVPAAQPSCLKKIISSVYYYSIVSSIID